MRQMPVAMLLAAGLTTGCAHEPAMSRQQYLAMTSRYYPDRSAEQVIAAAERVLRLADGDDFKFAHNPKGFVASRNWTIYVVLAASSGTDTWVLDTVPSGPGTRVNLQVGRQAAAIVPVSTTSGAMTATSLPSVGSPVEGTATYDLFWARLDYLLGKRPDWMSCDVADKRVSQRIAWGDNSALCNSFNVKDMTPAGPLW